jgi:hypothetical protein
MMIDVKDGEWFVEHDWRYRVRKAIRVTKQMVFYLDADWNNKERRVRLDNVVFSCPDPKLANLVADRLASSDALRDEEKRSAGVRCVERNAKIIANAKDEIAA